MKILLTNDDGYNSEGITILKNKLSKYGEVFIVAPLNHMSAKSCSINIENSVKANFVDDHTIALDGTPADCVDFAFDQVCKDFDIVISGCNNGINISFDTMYSGTIGASLQAIKHHVPTIAFSCEHNFDIVRKYFDDVWKFIIDNNLSTNKYILNVNFPVGDKVSSIELGRLFYRKDNTYFAKVKDEFFALRTVDNEGAPKDSDVYQVYHDIVSIVPLNGTLFQEVDLEDLKTKIS